MTADSGRFVPRATPRAELFITALSGTTSTTIGANWCGAADPATLAIMVLPGTQPSAWPSDLQAQLGSTNVGALQTLYSNYE